MDDLLQENGDHLLQETGDLILLEQQAAGGGTILPQAAHYYRQMAVNN